MRVSGGGAARVPAARRGRASDMGTRACGRAGGLLRCRRCRVGGGAGARFGVSAREEGASISVPARDKVTWRTTTRCAAVERGAVSDHRRARPHAAGGPPLVCLDGLVLLCLAADPKALEPQNV
eukprot:scaffold8621_cov67-Phaeocystis_antarctica.AAC.1